MAKTPARTSIILEGPDGAGKSTLGAQLVKDLGYTLEHTGGANSTLALLVTGCYFYEGLLSAGKGLILDRVPHISDAIYKKAMGDEPLAKSENVRKWLANAAPFVVVYVRRMEVEDMLSSILETKKDHKSPAYLEKVKKSYPEIVDLYDEEMEVLGGMYPVFDCYDWSTPKAYENLMKFLLQNGVRPCAA